MQIYVSLKSRRIPLLLRVIIVVSVDPMRVPRLLIRPDGASLLRTQLRLMHLHRTHSSHLGQHSGRLNLIGILLEHGRELRGQLLHLVIEALCLAEADCILLTVELELHHLVRVTEAPVAGLRISPLSVSRYAVNKTRNALRSVFQRTYQGKVFFFPSWIESSIWKMETYYKLRNMILTTRCFSYEGVGCRRLISGLIRGSFSGTGGTANLERMGCTKNNKL